MSRSLSLLTVVSITLLVLWGSPNTTEATNILGYFGSPARSHLLIHCAVADALAEAGHNVTVVASMPNVYKHAKYKYIQMESNEYTSQLMQQIVKDPKPIYVDIFAMISNIETTVNRSLSDPALQRFMRDHKHSFDLLILGYFFNDAQLGLGAYFNCPVVASLMIQPVYAVNSLVGNPTEEAYVPFLFGNLKQPMIFIERVQNYLFSIFEKYIMGSLLDLSMKKIYDLHFPSTHYRSLEEMRKNVSLVLVNHHVSQGPIRPNVPNVIEMGGIQIKEKRGTLPNDIKTILDNAENGVIYFSMGSLIDPQFISKDLSKKIFNVLSKMPYTVLWKWNADVPGKAENIFYKDWLPQDDILAHPNVKLFITHGGQGSVVESQYHGVPMIAMPFFGDQPANADGLVRNGFGLKQEFNKLTEDGFREAVNDVITNPKYTDAIKTFSKIYRDRPMTPRQLVVFWIEYVLRHKGAKHLQSPAVHLNMFQLKSWDVLAFIWTTVIVIIAVLVKTCQLMCCRRKSSSRNLSKIHKTKKSN